MAMLDTNSTSVAPVAASRTDASVGATTISKKNNACYSIQKNNENTLWRLADDDLLRHLSSSSCKHIAIIPSEEQRVSSKDDMSIVTTTTATSSTAEESTSSYCDVDDTKRVLSSSSLSSIRSSPSRRKIFSQYWKTSTPIGTAVVSPSVPTSVGSLSSGAPPSSPVANQIRAQQSTLPQHHPASSTTMPTVNNASHQMSSAPASMDDDDDDNNNKDEVSLSSSSSRRRRSIFGSDVQLPSRESSLESIDSYQSSISSFHELFASKRSQKAHRHLTVLSSSSSDTIQPFKSSSSSTTTTTTRRPRSRSCSDATSGGQRVVLLPPSTSRILQSCLKRRSRSTNSFNSSSNSSIIVATSRSSNSVDAEDIKSATDTAAHGNIDCCANDEFHDSNEHHDGAIHDDAHRVTDRCISRSISNSSHYSSGGSLSVRFDSHVEVVAFEEQEEEHIVEESSSSTIFHQGDGQYEGGWTDYFTNS